MKQSRFLCLLTALVCLLSLAGPALAAEVESGEIYCFSPDDFSADEELAGICITAVPEAGSLRLDNRILRLGDVLTAEQASRMTFHPNATEADADFSLEYLPIYSGGVDGLSVMSIAVIGRTDQVPVAEDSALETYRNLPNEGLLKVKDPEGQNLTYTVTRLPKRGDVVIRQDGSFIYTPKKNKVGVDSFTYTATDPAGNVSREATVTITVVKPSDAAQYTDTAGKSCRFAAEWMRNTGIFVGENVNGNGCFQPEKEVSRGDFLTMLVGVLDIPVDEDVRYTGFTDEAPQWLKPYLAAAMRAGLTTGWPDGSEFRADQPITGAEAAVMLQNALDLTVQTVTADEAVPVWAQQAVSVLADHGICLDPAANLTRGDAAQIMYQVSGLKASAPGITALQTAQ